MKSLTYAVGRTLWALVFFVGAFFARESVGAAPAPVRWEPLGYALGSDIEQTRQRLWPALYSFSKEPAGACNWSRSSGRSLNYCPGTADRDHYCTGLPRCGGIEEYEEDIGPVCYNYPGADIAPRDAVSRITVTRLPANPLVALCSCPAGTIPDLVGGFCLNKLQLDLGASRTRYLRKEAGKPISLDVSIRRVKGTGVADEPVSLSVQSSTGVAGTILPASGRTLTDGTFRAEYRFPAFTKSQTDTIVATCDNCEAPASVEIKMAPIVLGFFNGVWNTEKQASDGLKALEELVGPTHAGVPIDYQNFYNQTGSGLQDLAETFIQRGDELHGVLGNRLEHFWDLLSGRHSDPTSLTGSLLRGLGAAGLALAQTIDGTFNSTLGQIIGGWARLLSDPPTDADAGAQLAKLRALADEGSDFVLVAHSQGNLFVNLAFDGLRSSHPETSAKVVHVAPASPTTRGEYGLSGNDLVINGLRLQGITSVQLVNWRIPFGWADASGHTLVGTYLDATREGRGKTSALITNALNAL